MDGVQPKPPTEPALEPEAYNDDAEGNEEAEPDTADLDIIAELGKFPNDENLDDEDADVSLEIDDLVEDDFE